MPRNLTRKFSRFLTASVVSLSLVGCATVPGAGVAPGTPITADEAALGARQHEQLVAEFGGEVQGPLAAYVEQVGKNVAVQSGLGNARESFEVTLLNSPVPNAFAVPGGYVYVTRGLVALMNNEAELAAVLGHEVAHVAARHSAQRQQRSQRDGLFGVLGQVLSSVLLGDSALGRIGQELASTVPQLATLNYSRSQELEADRLGIQYLRGAGYDPDALAYMLQSLAMHNELDAQLQGRDARMPEWASTHPNPEGRVQNARQIAAAGDGVINRDTFLARIDGMIYGDTPEQGVIEGRTFIHPVLRLAFTAPQGFYMINGTRSVTISGDQGRAVLSTAAYNGNLESYVSQVFQGIGGQQQQIVPQSIQRTTVNGLPAAFGTARVNGQNGAVDVVVFAYEFSNGQAYHFAATAQAGGLAVFNPLFQSMRRISANEAAAIRPRLVDVITVQPGQTVESLARQMAYDTAQVARFRVLNGLTAGQDLTPGAKVKLVVRGR